MLYYFYPMKIDDIEIKEPPLQELKKERSCLKRSCITGGGCIILFFVASIFIVKFATTPPTRTLKTVPDAVSKVIPMYDEKNIQRITFTSGEDRGRAIEALAFVPKLVLSPLLVMLNEHNQAIIHSPRANTDRWYHINWQSFVDVLKTPITDQRDVLDIEWTELSAEPKFIADYYERALTRAEFIITTSTIAETTRELGFENDEIKGLLYIEDQPQNPGTDYFLMTVSLPLEKMDN